MECRTYWLPKAGNTESEYEDAAACDPVRGRCAVADGASESSFAGDWAALLVKGFVASPQPLLPEWSDWLPTSQAQFAKRAGGTTGPSLSWYSEIKSQLGAQAAFVGLAVGLDGPGQSQWQAVAVGDSCLFQVRRGQMIAALPIQSSAEFGLQPHLVSSLRGVLPAPETGECRAAGRWAQRDRFWLMTDALAPWFLGQHERGNDPWTHVERMLAQPNDATAFSFWVEKLREMGRIRNDDSTLVIIKP